jgi:hypothetical protein
VRAAIAIALALGLTGLGCAADDDAASTQRGSVAAGSLQALLQRSGEDVGLLMGTSDHGPGRVRVSFLVVTRTGRSIERPTALVWLARALEARPFQRVTARLERVGERERIYVANLSVREPGKYWLLAQPVGGTPVQGVGNVDVQDQTASPPIGSEAFPSRTPTLADASPEELTTRKPPDTELLRVSVADALARKEPFVLAFATPKYCQSRTCGPVVDVVDDVRKTFAGSGVRFIHVEIYEENNPALGTNRWVREWKLPSEPWVFLVGRDGRIKAKFEGALSTDELANAVRRFLT